MMPDGRGREKSESGVFLTVPIAVAMKTNCPWFHSLTGRIAVIFSFSINGTRLTIGLPRDEREPCGTL